jgi:short-subunit dehydrogenase
VILQLGSIVFSLQFPFKAQYCASKAALSGFTLSLRHEVKPFGIRVHLLEPGWVRSEFHRRLQPVCPPGSAYAGRLKPFLDYSRDQDPRVPDGARVARVILETLRNPKAPVRIAVGSDAKKFFRVSRFLSHNLMDKILGWKLSRKGRL